MIEEKDLRVTVRDGVRIGVRVYRPEGSGPFPALFAPSPYRYDNDLLPHHPMFLWRETGPIEWYVSQGYAYVRADVRGTGISEGEFRLLDPLEQHDLYDVIEWIAAQPWSNGKVGGIGESYFCMSQWFMGIENPPHLACLGAYDGMTDLYRYMAYPGGIEGNFLSYWFNSSVRVPNLYPANGDHPRHLSHDVFLDVQRHPFYDDFWKERTAAERLDRITVPLYSVAVWAKMDLHCAGNILGYQKARGPKKLLISGTQTALTAQKDFGEIDYHRERLKPFYDRFLKGETTNWDQRPNVEYAVRNTGVVRASETWPPPGTEPRRFYLASGPTGTVTSLNDGALASAPPASGSSSYAYPHPTWVLGVVHVGPQGPDPVRGVLTFTSAPLDADLEIAGHPKLVLHASSTRDDIDVIVKLSEQFQQSQEERAKGVQPRSFLATKGWHRASHRDRDPARSTPDVPFYTHERAHPLTPGQVYEIEVPLEPIAYRFRKGNRIRLEIVNGDSPVTDALFSHIWRPDKHGTDTIFHDSARPSHLILPILDVP